MTGNTENLTGLNGGLSQVENMQTTVKVSSGPHTQTKAIQHLSCLLTCGCKSQKLVVMISRGVQTTHRKLSPLPSQSDAILLSDFYLFFPHFSLPKKCNT